MKEEDRALILEIRNGKWPQKDVIDRADALTTALESLKDKDWIPKQPNREAIEEIVVDLHLSYWNTKGLI